ncbi:MAG: 3-keto-disaccharide hydrolase [Planctomycetia bacterium]
MSPNLTPNTFKPFRTPLWTLLAAGLFAATAVDAAEPKTIALFNGKDLDGWYTWTTDTKYENPGIFTVVDGQLKISGGEGDKAYFGAVITKAEYENYRLVVEYKWGPTTYGSRKDKSRDSGILVHCVGPDGPNPWPASVECQVIEGGTGDFILVGGVGADGKAVPHQVTVEAEKRDGQWYYSPGKPTTTVTNERVNWYARSLEWQDVVDFRGKDDVESPYGEWTRVEVVCNGDAMTNIVNGKTVNHGVGLALTKGKVLIQTEGAELYIRKIELTPLEAAAAR